jgi:hypothetical protein
MCVVCFFKIKNIIQFGPCDGEVSLFWVGTEFLNIPYTNFLPFRFKVKTPSLETKSDAGMTKGVKFCYRQKERQYKSSGFWKQIQENKYRIYAKGQASEYKNK